MAGNTTVESDRIRIAPPSSPSLLIPELLEEPLVFGRQIRSAHAHVHRHQIVVSAEEIRLADIGAGTVVGEMAVLSPAPRSATATCLEETIVAWLSRDTLLERLVLEDAASGVILRVSTEQVCDRLMAIRARADLLREALDGGDREFLSDRLTELVGGESGPLPNTLRKWLEGQ